MRIFITHILPDELISIHELSFAACNFSFNLISSGGFDKVYSTMGTYVGGGIESLAYKDNRFELLYCQTLRKMGKLGRLLANVVEQITLFHRIPQRSNLWLYNISTLNVVLYILLKCFKRSVKINVIELDFTPPTQKWSVENFLLYLLNHSHGVIKLADSPLFTNTNSVCLAGVTPKDAGNEPKILEPKMEFLLSGVLHTDISSIPMILDAFAQVPECKLHITGKWEDIDFMNSYTDRYPNIIYHGVLTFENYINLLHTVTFQLSLRNPDWGDNSCNFPSKIIEALLHNRIVVSTIHYNQINGIKYFETERSEEGFVAILKILCSMSKDELLRYANQGQEIVNRFSASVWKDWMYKIENVKI